MFLNTVYLDRTYSSPQNYEAFFLKFELFYDLKAKYCFMSCCQQKWVMLSFKSIVFGCCIFVSRRLLLLYSLKNQKYEKTL